ncbi:MAG: Nre family DNA repair protein [Candidatus Bathyarchaeia archaeon]
MSSAMLEVSGVRLVTHGRSPCLSCRGGRMLCGRSYCPILSKAEALIKHLREVKSIRVEGSSPPGIFVGRMGYPKVYAGPMTPPFRGDTSILDAPERWVGKSFQEIIDYRYSLIRGKRLMAVDGAADPDEFLSTLQELSMASGPVDSEALLKRRPSNIIVLSEFSQPFGPSAPLKDYRVESIKTDHRIEEAFYDGDLPASKAVISLYREGVPVTSVQRCFSAGVLGIRSKRRLVPTRWAITAVDDIVSKAMLIGIRDYPLINEFRTYSFKHLGNMFAALLYPSRWEFEWIEAWFPGTTWNVDGWRPELIGDHEGFKGRSEYAHEIGGCYYAARLAAVEALEREKRQAGVLILREIYPDYVLPVGVWNVRESVRRLLDTGYERFDRAEDAVKALMNRLKVPYRTWLSKSELLQGLLVQERLESFFPKSGGQWIT